MTAAQIAVDVLLWAVTGTTALSCLGMLVMHQDVFQQLHYLAPVADIAAVLLVAAVGIQEGWGQALVKTILIAAVLILMNAVLAHATARAARVRHFGYWNPHPDEHIEGSPGRGGQARQQERRRNE